MVSGIPSPTLQKFNVMDQLTDKLTLLLPMTTRLLQASSADFFFILEHDYWKVLKIGFLAEYNNFSINF